MKILVIMFVFMSLLSTNVLCQSCGDTGCGDNCHCKNRTSCGRNGNCSPWECVGPWKGNDCQTPCYPKQPTKCGEDCHCSFQRDCGGTDCRGFCRAGWGGSTCQSVCPDGKAGSSCRWTCHCADPLEVCNKTTAECKSGCETDFYDLEDALCQNECKPGSATKCGSDCHCYMSRSAPGRCGDTCYGYCMPGWTGKNCQTPCPDGSSGYRCENNCSCADKTEVCNKTTGACASGCRAGFKGSNCLTRCYSKTITKCGEDCHCSFTAYCGWEKCEGGCRPGYEGTDCQTECPSGKFGANCTGTCHCVPGVTCNKMTGECPGACEQGWRGDNCQTSYSLTPCDGGKYGPNCDQNCNCPNRQSSICDRTTGVCPAPCISGFTGPNCGTDIDECTDNPSKCGDNGNCTNTIGSYRCNCPDRSISSGKACTSEAAGKQPSNSAAVGAGVGAGIAILAAVFVVVVVVVYRRRRQALVTVDQGRSNGNVASDYESVTLQRTRSNVYATMTGQKTVTPSPQPRPDLSKQLSTDSAYVDVDPTVTHTEKAQSNSDYDNPPDYINLH